MKCISNVSVSKETISHLEYTQPLKYPCGGIVCISQMVDSYILEFDNATLGIVAPGTNDYFDLNVATYKKVWNNFEFELGLNHPYGN